MRTRIIPNTNTFHAVFSILVALFHIWHVHILIFWKLEYIRVLVDNVWKSKTELLSKLPHHVKFVSTLVFSDPYFPNYKRICNWFNIRQENADQQKLISRHISQSVFLKWVMINPFESSVTFLYPLKTSENLWFSDVFRGYRNMSLD